MPRDPHLAARMAAFSAGMSAKAGELVREDLHKLRDQVQNDLNEDSRLRRAVESFVLDCEAHFRDPVKLAELGADLCAYIDVMNMPEPVDAERADING